MKLKHSLKALAALVLVFGVAIPRGFAAFDPIGEDIDIFLANPSFTAERPNVLLMVDNTANWNQAFANEKSAMVTVVKSISNEFNVGLMLFNESGQPDNHGAYVRFGIRQMTSTNKTALMTVINNFDQLGDKGNNNEVSEMMYEAYAYWAGITANLGFGQAKRDYGGNTANNPPAAGLPGNAFPDAGTNTYTSPITSGCQKNFQIYISNGPAAENTQALSDAQTKLAGLVGKNPPDTISINPNGQQGNWMDEYAKFLANGDCRADLPGNQSVTTYVLEVDPTTSGQGPAMTALLESVAINGKGKYFAVSSANGGAEIVKALNQILGEVQSVNSVFASSSMPVSVNVRGTNLNQVYIGVFRPDPAKSPRWFGNLKLYDLASLSATGDVFLADANNFAATNSSTGFISNSALSFWTKPSTFWNFRAPFAPTDVGQGSDSPDGDLVEKGGVAEQLRIAFPTSQTARKLYTCTGTCTNGTDLSSATPFDTTNAAITPAILGAYTTYPVDTIQTPLGSTTATASRSSGSFPFSNGDSVTISGATPTLYDGTFTIFGATSNSFQFTLPSAPNGNTGTATATNHGLNTNDFVDVTGATPAAYNVSDAAIIKIDANTFTYGLSAAAGTSSSGQTVFGKKLVQTLTAAGTTATATLPSHGYSAATSIRISGVSNDTVFNGTFTITSATTNTFTYNLSAPSSLAGTTAQATSVGHGFSSGQSVTIAGATPSAYNGTFTVTVVDANTFTYALPSGQSVSAVGAISATSTVTNNVTSITHPTSGSSATKNTATVTTSSPHGFSTNNSITIANAAQAAYNGTYVITVIDPTHFTYSNASINLATTPATVASGQTSITASKTTTRTVTSLSPAVTATGTILSSRQISPISITVQTNATGQILAGRKSDADAPQRDNIINWVRGQDNKEDENANSSSTDIRSSVHGDVLHSRPAVVNYNRAGANGSNTGDNDVFVFYGSNDGVFRAIQGGGIPTTANPTPPTNSGSEAWGFVASEFFGKLKRLRDNNPPIGTVSPAAPRDYFFDGPIGAYTLDVNGDRKLIASDGDKVQLFLGMRRGGRMIYALDVSDPARPVFMWKRGCPNLTDNVGCDSGFEELGETWSEPRVGFLRAFVDASNNPIPVLIFGAGYDPTVEDFQPCLITSMPPDASSPTGAPTSVTAQTGGSVTFTSSGGCTSAGTSSTTVNRSMGRGIFIVNATNGNLLFRFGADAGANLRVADMQYAMPADVIVLNRDGDNTRALPGVESIQPRLRGFVDRIYATDTGGQVWRLDVDPANTTLWAATKLAAISGTALSDKRKFLFPPDVVASSDANGNYDAVLVGSGDREHPFDATVTNRYYMFKDRKFTDVNPASVSPTAPITEADLFDATNDCLQDVSICPAGSTQLLNAQNNLLNSKGWMLTLGSGEKVVGSSITVAGTTFFGTNQPSSTAGGANCGSNLGIARIYEIGFEDATAKAELNATAGLSATDRSAQIAGGGFPPSPDLYIPTICNGPTCTERQTVCLGPNCVDPGSLKFEARIRTYWYRKVE